MSNRPTGWVDTTTADLLGYVTSGSRGWARYYANEGAAFIRVGNLKRRSITPDLLDLQYVAPPEGAEGSRTRVASNDILISITADLGRVALMRDVPGPTYINQHVALARPTPLICAPYLAWYLTSEAVQRQWAAQQRGVTKLGLGLADIRSINVPLPPLAEQERIVAAIEEQFSRLDAGVAALERVRQNLMRMRDSVLRAAATGRLVPQDPDEGSGHKLLAEVSATREGFKAAVAPSADLPNVPRSWAVTSLEALTDPKRVICYGILMPRVKEGSTVPYVEVKDLRAGQLSLAFLHRTSQELHSQFLRSTLQAGDVLLAIRGSYDRAAVVPTDLTGANISRDVARIAPLPGVDPAFLCAYLTSPPALSYLKERARGVAVKGVNIADIRSMPIPLPPRSEQRRIVDEIQRHGSVLDKVAAALQHDEGRVENLRSSILTTAFSGRLVPQHPDDEPATALLSRIVAARTSPNGYKPSRSGARRKRTTA